MKLEKRLAARKAARRLKYRHRGDEYDQLQRAIQLRRRIKRRKLKLLKEEKSNDIN